MSAKEPTFKELYRRARPSKLNQVFGQEGAVRVVQGWTADGFPHAVGLFGPSGTGKTTIARIMAKRLKCGEHDFIEVNCANASGVDDVRELAKNIRYAPISGPVTFVLLDECHKLTDAAQNALLKELEDTPDHVYYALASTDPKKVIKTVHSRLKVLELRSLTEKAAIDMMRGLITAHMPEAQVSDVVLRAIHESAEGGARKMVQILEEVAKITGEKEQLSVIADTENATTVFELFKALVWGGAQWARIAEILTGLDNENAEGVRRAILTMSSNQILKAKSPTDKTAIRCSFIIDCCRRNLFDTGKAGLVDAMFEIYRKP